jgi:RNA-directed DNA polymerase
MGTFPSLSWSRASHKIATTALRAQDQVLSTVDEQGKWLRRVVAGHFAYYAVPTNSRALSAFRHYVGEAVSGAARE